MSPELQNKLIKKYPEFFEYLKGYEGPIIPICFGFECGDGWYTILSTLMDTIHNHIENKKKYPDKQIKSKFWRWFMPKLKHWFRYKRKFWKLLHKFEYEYLEKEIFPAPEVNITQIKEKFGGLRFYYNGGDYYIDGMVRLAENLSYETCEFCGSTKKVGSTDGWIYTICKECFDKGEVNLKTWKPNEEESETSGNISKEE